MWYHKLSKPPWRRHPIPRIREGGNPIFTPFYQVSCSPLALGNGLNIGFCSNKKYNVKQKAWGHSHLTEGTVAWGEDAEITTRGHFLPSSLREYTGSKHKEENTNRTGRGRKACHMTKGRKISLEGGRRTSDQPSSCVLRRTRKVFTTRERCPSGYFKLTKFPRGYQRFPATWVSESPLCPQAQGR